MKKAIFLFILLSTATASSQPISAKKAAEKPPVPTFKDAHRAFTRVVLNESGWKSKPDMNGITEILVSRGGGRDYGRRYPGAGYGLDYRRFITYTAKASLKTFPIDDPWAYPIMVMKYDRRGETALNHHVKRQKDSVGNVYWTSSFKLNCSEPDRWKEVYPNTQWEGFTKRCANLVKMTAEYLKGQYKNWCRTQAGEPATPQFWGSKADVLRNKRKNWEEIFCDKPETNCQDRQDPNNTSCAKNRWFRLGKK
jgi:hypothetical protein